MDKKIKHLEMIENVIERMGRNSFQLKGWTVTLVSIIGALSARESDKRFIYFTIIPLLAFWVIDSYYLQIERKYKELFEIVRCQKEEMIDFNMSTKNITIEKTPMRYWRCMLSKSEVGFYGSVLVAVAVLVIILKVW